MVDFVLIDIIWLVCIVECIEWDGVVEFVVFFVGVC